MVEREWEKSHKSRLALHIIEAHFGDVTASVARHLLQHRDVSLSSLVEHAQREHPSDRFYVAKGVRLSRERIKHALIVLLQHNCLIVDVHEIDAHYSYNLDADMVICRIRYPKLVQLVHSLFGEVGEAIIEEVLLFGRIQLHFIKEGAAQNLYRKQTGKQGESTDRNREEELSVLREHVSEVFSRLVSDGLVVHVQSIERKSAARAAVAEHTRAESEVGRTGKRKADPFQAMGPASKAAKGKAKTPVRREERSGGTEGGGEGGADDFLWTAGWARYYEHARNAVCVTAAKDRLDDCCSRIVGTLLAGSTGLLSKLRSPGMSLEDVLDKVDVKLDVKRLQKHMDELINDAVQFVSKEVTASGINYMFNTEQVVAQVKRRAVHGIAVKAFDPLTARIVELLFHTKYLEQGKVGDLAIMPAQEAKRRLYQLFRSEWVRCVDVYRKSDYGAASTSFVWHIDVDQLYGRLKEDCCLSILNLRLRRQHEYAARKDVVSQQTSNKFDAAKYGKLMAELELLGLSLLKVDATLVLFDKL